MALSSLRPAVLCSLTIACGLGMGVGYSLGRRSAPGGAPAIAPSPAHTAATLPPPSPRDPASAPPAIAPPAPARLALTTAPAGPAAEAQTLLELAALAATDPLRALDLAATAPTPRQRALFRAAALRGWAGRDPLAAADWTLVNVRADERQAAVEAVAAGAIADPEAALVAFDYLVATDPVHASEHGVALAEALARDGQFLIASRFAATGPAACHATWLGVVYQNWAAYEPGVALETLARIPDPVAREEARAALFVGWSRSDPAALVGHAATLPVGEARFAALRDGLTQWVHLDPAAASVWMDTHDPAPDLDAGAAAIANTPALVAKNPSVAASWAESITDPELRASTLLDFIRLWAEHDPAAARRYAATSPSVSPQTRDLAIAGIDNNPP